MGVATGADNSSFALMWLKHLHNRESIRSVPIIAGLAAPAAAQTWSSAQCQEGKL